MDMNFNFNLLRKFSYFVEQEKKLAVKVIAGVLLIAVAFVFYLVKEFSAEGDMAVISAENGEAIGMESDKTDSAAKAGAGGGASGKDAAIAGDDVHATSTAVEAKNMIIVDVSGAVANPSVVELPEGSRVFEAIEKAGGLTNEADIQLINRAAVLADGQKIYIPTKQEVSESRKGKPPAAAQYIPGINDSDTGPGQSNLININTADSATLQQLSGIGPATAQKIIEYRTTHGNFKTIEDIKNVSGIGDKTFEKFKDKITI